MKMSREDLDKLSTEELAWIKETIGSILESRASADGTEIKLKSTCRRKLELTRELRMELGVGLLEASKLIAQEQTVRIIDPERVKRIKELLE